MYNSVDSERQAYLDKECNIGVRLIDHLSKGVVSQIQVLDPHDTNTISPGNKQKSKETVRKQLAQGLLQTL